MQSFGTLLGDNKSMAVLIGLIAAVVVVVVLLLLYRVLFGRRLHMSGGRSRQPRLGVVDAFDLDRQRQLVLVRRDNVEHLIMIGGPNDLVIESAFVRAQPSVQVANGRDKEATLPAAPAPSVAASASAAPVLPTAAANATPAPLLPAPTPAAPPEIRPPLPAQAPAPRGTAQPLDLTHPVAPGDLGPLADLPPPGPVAEPAATPPVTVRDAVPPPPPATPEAQDTPPATPAPARPPLVRATGPAKPAGSGTVLPPRPPLTSLRTAAGSGPPKPPVAPPARPAGMPPTRAPLPAPLRRDLAPPAGTTAGSTALAEGATAPDKSTAPVVASDAPPRPDSPLPITLDSIESLEEEMAKLLGRASTDKK